ncbi:MAG: hypothetical protein LBK60_01190 [Verrucomicrobiales bacterium]|jgi:tetratricopeptide (TPR) repeat protein|nr:hypothetical protein [Verrucomicrobiales bacterium]
MKLLPTLALAAALCPAFTVSGGTRSASGEEVPSPVLAAAEQRVTGENIPAPLRPHFVRLYSEGPQNAVLHNMRGGLAAFRARHFELAKKCLDDAIAGMENLIAGGKRAEDAKSDFVEERRKWFKGENYEQSALYFYRGLLYLRDGDFGNAAACFKRCEIMDITGDDARDFAGDWYAGELALALASRLNGYAADSDAALRRAAGFSFAQFVQVPPPTATTNTLLVVETGSGPEKYGDGQYNEKLKYRVKRPFTVSVNANGVSTSAAEDLFFQATTRGTRQVDYILNSKAELKEDLGKAGVGLAAAAFTAAAIAARVDGGTTALAVGGGLAVASVGTMIVSSLTTPQADTRAWHNLPRSIFLLHLETPAGTDNITVSGLTPDGKTTYTKSVPLHTVSGAGTNFKIGFAKFDH